MLRKRLKSHDDLWFWGGAGLALVILHIGLAWLSQRFRFDQVLIEKPIVTLVVLLLIASTVYLAAVWKAWSTKGNRSLLLWIIVIGACMRAAMMPSTPMLEDDYFRYMWDGAVVANGFSPYRYVPTDAANASDSVPSEVRELAAESGSVISRVNHPNLRTIYPPVAQAAFAASYWLRPWSLIAWRCVVLAFDVATLCLLLFILRSLGLPLVWIVIYWWSPLVVKQIINSAHMDVIIMPFVLGAVMLSSRGRFLWSACLLAMAMGAKLWPVILMPVILIPIWNEPKKLISAISIVGLLCLAMFIPIYASGLDSSSGFTAYGRHWEMNDGLYMLFLWATQFVLEVASLSALKAQLVTRVLVFFVLAAWIAWLCRRKPTEHWQFWERSLLIVAALFLLSPTQFPWYYLWVMPFLVIRPRASLILLSALLPLYYLRFYFQGIDRVGVFDNGIVWIQYIPPCILLLREWIQSTTIRASGPLERGGEPT